MGVRRDEAVEKVSAEDSIVSSSSSTVPLSDERRIILTR